MCLLILTFACLEMFLYLSVVVLLILYFIFATELRQNRATLNIEVSRLTK